MRSPRWSRRREFLTRKLAKAETERRKLLDAYYAGAIDVTTLKAEQARIAADVRGAEECLAAVDAHLAIIVHTLIQLGKDLALTTLAEGIQTKRQMDHLRGEHVNEAQGFLLAKPLVPASFQTQILDATLRARPAHSSPRSAS